MAVAVAKLDDVDVDDDDDADDVVVDGIEVEDDDDDILEKNLTMRLSLHNLNMTIKIDRN